MANANQNCRVGLLTSTMTVMVERCRITSLMETPRNSSRGAGPAVLENNMVVTYDPVSSALSRSTPPMPKELKTQVAIRRNAQRMFIAALFILDIGKPQWILAVQWNTIQL